jgi:hypothetical protein
MAVRRPLYNLSGDLKEMSDSMIDSIIDRSIYEYSQNPSAFIYPANSGTGNMGSLTDTRKIASTVTSHPSSFQTPGSLGDTSVTHNRMLMDQIPGTIYNTPINPTDDTGKTFPVYNDSGNIRAMSLQDMKDTFLHPAIDLLVGSNTSNSQAGTYTLHTSTSLSNHSLLTGTAMYTDTRYNGTTNVSSTRDRPSTVTNYYLFRRTWSGSAPTYTSPMYITGSNDIQEYTQTNFDSLLSDWLRYTAASSTDGYKINYNINGSGTTRATMTDTRLTGNTTRTLFVNADDYRSQRFPAGSSSAVSTYQLKIRKL